jgi:hypothetical protein
MQPLKLNLNISNFFLFFEGFDQTPELTNSPAPVSTMTTSTTVTERQNDVDALITEMLDSVTGSNDKYSPFHLYLKSISIESKTNLKVGKFVDYDKSFKFNVENDEFTPLNDTK